jgi:hypothetical protein
MNERKMKLEISNWQESTEYLESNIERSFEFELNIGDISEGYIQAEMHYMDKDWWNGYTESMDIWTYPEEDKFIGFFDSSNKVMCSQKDGRTK